MMHATPEQERILREAVAAIQAHPTGFDMNEWVSDCGTAFCLAGWIVRSGCNDAEWARIVRLARDGRSGIPRRAQQALGDDAMAAHRLFLLGSWPDQFVTVSAYGELSVTPEQLEARVEHWIQTGE